MKYINFKQGNWEDKIEYAYTVRFDETPKFIQEDDCIRNEANPAARFGYDNVSIMTLEKYGTDTQIELSTALCGGQACAVVILANELTENADGVLKFADYVEVVLYNKGINVWIFENSPDDGLKWHRRLGVSFPVEHNVEQKLIVQVIDKNIRILHGEQDIIMRVNELPQEFHVGLNVCEGITKLFNLDIKTMKDSI